ncbi:MAG: virulence factor [Candidatus Handelsmanbacteria bacterium]|nr:virulence factor [Candidatus Handelsmanbacteria bacterium]
MARYQVLYWRNIPAQVKAYEGKRPVSHPLSERFQVEIDRVAMKEGLSGNDAYLEQWQWSAGQERPGSPREVLEQVALELEAQYETLVGRNL